MCQIVCTPDFLAAWKQFLLSTYPELPQTSLPADQESGPFMLKEIHEQAAVIQTCLQKCRNPAWSAASHSRSHLPSAVATDRPFELGLPDDLLLETEQIHIVACGTSRHAGLIAQYWLEQWAGLPTRVRSASEFVAAPLPMSPRTLTIAITQSGETADTLVAVELEIRRRSGQAISLQPCIIGVTNNPTSSLTHLVDYLLPTFAGTEVGVAATKTFTAQLMTLLCMALELARIRRLISKTKLERLLTALEALPGQINTLFRTEEDRIAQLATQLALTQNLILLGQGSNRAIALEGALKLKETTYIHAEGYAAGEFLHGPIALLEPTIPVIAIVPTDHATASVLKTIRKVKSHGVPTIGIFTAKQVTEMAPWFDHAIVVPDTAEALSPFLKVIPLQLLAYYIAINRQLNVDRPRHITKTLT